MRSLRLIAALAVALGIIGAARADDAPPSTDAKPPKHKVTQSDSYVEVDPMYATILDGDKPVGMLMVGIGIDIPDAKLRAEAQRVMPVLRDAFLRNLMNFSATAVRSWQQPDVGIIADRLQGVTDRALGQKGARILLAQVALRISH